MLGKNFTAEIHRQLPLKVFVLFHFETWSDQVVQAGFEPEAVSEVMIPIEWLQTLQMSRNDFTASYSLQKGSEDNAINECDTCLQKSFSVCH